MEYLCSQRIVHGDLAARNVLVGAEAQLKISDLGLGRHTYPHEYYAPPGGLKTAPLPVRWLPPESIFTGVVSSESNVWSLAVTLWEVRRKLFSLRNCCLSRNSVGLSQVRLCGTLINRQPRLFANAYGLQTQTR